MTKEPQQKTAGEIPESWQVPEQDIQTAWDKKAEQFSYFKTLFKNRRGQETSE